MIQEAVIRRMKRTLICNFGESKNPAERHGCRQSNGEGVGKAAPGGVRPLWKSADDRKESSAIELLKDRGPDRGDGERGQVSVRRLHDDHAAIGRRPDLMIGWAEEE